MTLRLAIEITADASGVKTGAAQANTELDKIEAGLKDVRREADATAAALDKVGKTGAGSPVTAGPAPRQSAPPRPAPTPNTRQPLQSWQRQQLTYQGFDVFTSLASGMNPAVVAAQQGPQIIQAYGGIAPTLEALGRVVTPLRLGMLGLTGAVIAGGAAWAGYLQSTKEVETSLAGLGRSSGASVTGLEAIAQTAAARGDASITQARALEAQLLRTGRIGIENFEGLIGIAKDFAATIGTDVAGAGDKLGQIFADPAKGAQQLQQIGLLDGATARLVARLAEQNRVTEAQSVLLNGLAPRLADAAAATTAAGRAAEWAGQKWDGFWDALGRGIDSNFGFESIEQAITRIRGELQIAVEKPWWLGGPDQAGIQALQDRLADYQEQLRRQQGLTSRRAQDSRDDRTSSSALQEAARLPVNDFANRARDLDALNKRLQAAAGAAGLSPEEQQSLARAIDATGRAVATLISPLQQKQQLDQIDIAIARERDPLVRAELAARRERIALAGEEITTAEAETRIQQARNRVLEESRTAAIALLRSQEAQREGLLTETALIGQSQATRARVLALMEAEQQIRSQGIQGGSAEASMIRSSAAALADLRTELERQQDAWRTVQSGAEGALDAIGDALSGKTVDWKDILQGFYRDAIQLTAINPLKNALLGTNYGTASDLGGILGRLAGNDNSPIASALGQLGATPATPMWVQVVGAAIASGAAGILGLGSLGGTGAGGLNINAAAQAIRTIETGSAAGNYGIMGPLTASGDRAYGAYQVMGANVGPWTQKWFGQQLTPEQFLANSGAQDAVFNGQFGSYAAKYGPQGAARAWFGGEGGMNRLAAQDVVGTSVGGYNDRFGQLYQQFGGQLETSTQGLTTALDTTANSVGGFGTGLDEVARTALQSSSGIATSATKFTGATETAAGAATDFTGGLGGAFQQILGGIGQIGSGFINGFGSILNSLLGGIGGGGGLGGLGSLFGFADGGIMTSTGPLQLHRYAMGGIADRPQLALFGEGRQSEAFVPLPDGRRIPVALSMTGGAAGNDNSMFRLAASMDRLAERVGNGGPAAASRGQSVHFHGFDPAEVRVEERQEADGSYRTDIYRDEQVAAAINRRGSATNRALAARGAGMPMVRR